MHVLKLALVELSIRSVVKIVMQVGVCLDRRLGLREHLGH